MKPIRLKLFLLAIFSFTTLYSQHFNSRYLEVNGYDMNHYNIESYDFQGTNGYIISGTVFNSNGDNDMHILFFNDQGILQWEQFFDYSIDDRALDITYNTMTGEIAFTGYIASNTDVNGDLLYQLVVVTLYPSNGIIHNQMVLDQIPGSNGLESTVGTNITFTDWDNSYIVGGFTADIEFPTFIEIKPFIRESSALVLRISEDLQDILSSNYFRNDFLGDSHNSINDIVPYEDGVIVIGSVENPNQPSLSPSMLILKLDMELNIVNSSGRYSVGSSTNVPLYEAIGVSGVISEDFGFPTLVVVYNYAPFHGPGILVFKLSNFSLIETTSSSASNPKYTYEIDPLPNHTKEGDPAAFKITKSAKSDYFNITGYFSDYHINSATNPYNHAVPFISEFELIYNSSNNTYELGNLDSKVRPFQAWAFTFAGGGLFSTYQVSSSTPAYGFTQPYIYNQEMACMSPNGAVMALITPVETQTGFKMELSTIDFSSSDDNCFINNLRKKNEFDIQVHDIEQLDHNNTISEINFNYELNSTETLLSCGGGSGSGRFKSSTIVEPDVINSELLIYPNPTTGKLYIESEAIIDKIDLINNLGAKVFTYKYVNSFIQLPEINSFYLLQIYFSDGSIINRKIIKE